jgi:hypothetical protein
MNNQELLSEIIDKCVQLRLAGCIVELKLNLDTGYEHVSVTMWRNIKQWILFIKACEVPCFEREAITFDLVIGDTESLDTLLRELCNFEQEVEANEK